MGLVSEVSPWTAIGVFEIFDGVPSWYLCVVKCLTAAQITFYSFRSIIICDILRTTKNVSLPVFDQIERLHCLQGKIFFLIDNILFNVVIS
jgi:hypothetical protein